MEYRGVLMEMDGLIKTADELEFAIFCVENVAAAMHTDAADVYRALTDKSDILREYIVPCYDVLHTQGKEYIVNDILEVMRERGIIL